MRFLGDAARMRLCAGIVGGVWPLATALYLLPGAVSAAEPAVGSSAASPVHDASASGYRLDERDVIDVMVYGEASLSGKYIVHQGGVVDLPLLHEVKVAGMIPLEAAAHIEKLLRERFLVDPHVTVQVATFGSKPVQVLGGVKNPGVYYLSGPTSLLEILAKAGGMDGDRSTREVHVQHGQEPPIVVDLDKLVGSGVGNVTLQADDVVYVPQGLVVYVAGQVTAPGAVPFAEGLTVSQAMTRAGGWKPTANLRQVYLLRDGVRTQIDFKRILQGRQSDVTLVPGDQLFIEESIF